MGTAAIGLGILSKNELSNSQGKYPNLLALTPPRPGCREGLRLGGRGLGREGTANSTGYV